MRLYVEGGGESAALNTACREGFSKFLQKAKRAGRMPRIIACGSRRNAYESFCIAIRNGQAAMLLVDSEEGVLAVAQPGSKQQSQAWRPWLHLKNRQGDGWAMPQGSKDMQCHLMVQCMEAWLLADPQALEDFFGQGFRRTALPAIDGRLEEIDKDRLYQALAKATAKCKTKSRYGKGEHSFKLLGLIDPSKVTAASPWAKRFIDAL
ncbi:MULTISPECIES: DUF4276 family protein [Pseudomonas]|uniref:DUF4276 family protein n=1 Tax=Pseudomonas TaxID=286 RepID=UPI0008C98314|nr:MULTISPECIES: DUF4276 family protein [Pseudomonas]SEO46388.1 protein of unknown function [Pseudomonas sp. Snoq117.2]